MSAVVQLAFGSFGDIVGLLQLIAELCIALHAARDSSDDIRALVDDLRAFSSAIDEVKIALERRHTALRPGLLNGITSAVSLCHTMLRDVQRRINKFNQRRLHTLGPFAWGKYLAACAWAICGEKRVVATLKQRMWEQLGLVHTMLAIAQINDQGGLFSAVNSQKASLQQLHQSMSELHYLSDGYPPFFFFDKDGTRFKPVFRMTFEAFRILLGYQRSADGKPLTPPHPDGGPVYKLKLVEEHVQPRPDDVPAQCEMHWIYHRNTTSETSMVFIGLPSIIRDHKLHAFLRLVLVTVPGVQMFPCSSREMAHQHQSPEEPTPLVPFLYPAFLAAYMAPLFPQGRGEWDLCYQEFRLREIVDITWREVVDGPFHDESLRMASQCLLESSRQGCNYRMYRNPHLPRVRERFIIISKYVLWVMFLLLESQYGKIM